MCDNWTRGAPLCFSVSISFDWHHDMKGMWGSALQDVIYGDSKECCWSRLDVQEREASDRNELGFHKKWNFSSWLSHCPATQSWEKELPFIFWVLPIKCSAPRTNANLRDTWKLKSVYLGSLAVNIIVISIYSICLPPARIFFLHMALHGITLQDFWHHAQNLTMCMDSKNRDTSE